MLILVFCKHLNNIIVERSSEMRKLTTKEMQNINGGTTWKCSTCGYKTTSSLKAAYHGGIFSWHFFNGGHWIVS